MHRLNSKGYKGTTLRQAYCVILNIKSRCSIGYARRLSRLTLFNPLSAATR
jgi:hypothetical protein